MFNFIVIDPRRPVVPPNTLGIEVTIPEIAARCDLGNIDPQHGNQPCPRCASASRPHDRGDLECTACGWDFPRDARAAIEVAISYPLPVAPADPSKCVTLATIRPDLDAFGAMAVLALRAGPGSPLFGDTDAEVNDLALDRIRSIAAADGNAATTWAPRALPTVENPWPPGVEIGSRRELAAIAAVVSDYKLAPATRVACVAAWILGGEEPSAEVVEATSQAVFGVFPEVSCIDPVVTMREARARVEAERADMIAALSDGRIKITCVFNQTDRTAPRERERFRGEGPVLFTTERHVVVERLGSTCYEPNDFAAYAIVRSAHRAATSLGQSVAPLAICFHPSFHWPQGHATPKATVAWAVPPGAEVVARVRDALNAAEREKIATQIDSIDLGVTYEGDFPGVFFDARPGRPAVGAATLLRGGHISEALDVIANMRSADAERFAKDVAVITAAIKSEWGGNLASGILGSPQGRASLLTEDEIVSTVRGAL